MIERFLSEQAASGEDKGHGSFTVLEQKAWEKLRSFSFPRKFDWLLALIQACHAAPQRPSTLKIGVGRRTTSATLIGVAEGLLDEFESAFSQLDGNPEYLNIFRRAFWGALEQGELRVIQGAYQLCWNGEKLVRSAWNSELQAADCLRWELTPSRASLVSWVANSLGRARMSIELSRELAERTWSEKLGIEIGGRPVEKPWFRASSDESKGASLHLVSCRETASTVELERCWNFRKPNYKKPLYKATHQVPEASLHFLCQLELLENGKLALHSQKSSIAIVKHGVIVHQVHSKSVTQVSCQLVAIRDEISTDLSGLQGQKEASQALQEELGQALGASWIQIQERLLQPRSKLGRLKNYRVPLDFFIRLSLGGVVAVFVAGAFKTSLLGVPGGLLAGGMLLGLKDNLKIGSLLDLAVRETFVFDFRS